MFHIVLHQPEIPPNTGNIIRLCANTGAALHLIEPLGFHLTDKHLKRAGLDYELSNPLQRYSSFDDYLQKRQQTIAIERIFLCTTKATTLYAQIDFKPG